MTTYYQSPLALIPQWLNDIGIILSGGKITTYQAGTTTLQQTFTDATAVTPNSNPIILGSNGRLQNVSIWVAAGTLLKAVITDANNNPIGPTLDQIASLADPVASLTVLANPALTGANGAFGANLVANALVSYDLVASVRSAFPPNLASGQTMIIAVEGGTIIGDGGGGFYYWSASSSATDDGTTVIKPTTVSGAGRYLRMLQSGVAGQVTVSLGGCTTTPTATANYYVIGNFCVMRFPQLNATSNSTSCQLSFPGGVYSPTQAQLINVAAIEDNGAGFYSQVADINPPNLGTITINLRKNGSTTGFTAAGAKGIGDGSGGQFNNTLTWLLT